MWRLWLALGAALAAACGPDCAPSADIRVSIAPAPGVDLPDIASLRVVLSIEGAQPRTLEFVLQAALDANAAFLLRPDPPPADHYDVTITVEALTKTGELEAVGTTEGVVAASGCNRLSAPLLPLPETGEDGGS